MNSSSLCAPRARRERASASERGGRRRRESVRRRARGAARAAAVRALVRAARRGELRLVHAQRVEVDAVGEHGGDERGGVVGRGRVRIRALAGEHLVDERLGGGEKRARGGEAVRADVDVARDGHLLAHLRHERAVGRELQIGEAARRHGRVRVHRVGVVGRRRRRAGRTELGEPAVEGGARAVRQRAEGGEHVAAVRDRVAVDAQRAARAQLERHLADGGGDGLGPAGGLDGQAHQVHRQRREGAPHVAAHAVRELDVVRDGQPDRVAGLEHEGLEDPVEDGAADHVDQRLGEPVARLRERAVLEAAHRDDHVDRAAGRVQPEPELVVAKRGAPNGGGAVGGLARRRLDRERRTAQPERRELRLQRRDRRARVGELVVFAHFLRIRTVVTPCHGVTLSDARLEAGTPLHLPSPERASSSRRRVASASLASHVRRLRRGRRLWWWRL